VEARPRRSATFPWNRAGAERAPRPPGEAPTQAPLRRPRRAAPRTGRPPRARRRSPSRVAPSRAPRGPRVEREVALHRLVDLARLRRVGAREDDLQLEIEIAGRV